MFFKPTLLKSMCRFAKVKCIIKVNKKWHTLYQEFITSDHFSTKLLNLYVKIDES